MMLALAACQPTINPDHNNPPEEDPIVKPDPEEPLAVTVTTGEAAVITTTSATLNLSWADANGDIREAGFLLGAREDDLQDFFQADLSSTGPAGTASYSLEGLYPDFT